MTTSNGFVFPSSFIRETNKDSFCGFFCACRRRQSSIVQSNLFSFSLKKA